MTVLEAWRYTYLAIGERAVVRDEHGEFLGLSPCGMLLFDWCVGS